MSPSRRHPLLLLVAGFAIAGRPPSRGQGSGPPAPPPPAAAKPALQLAPVVVSSKPIGSFGLSVRVLRDAMSAKVAELTILDVIPHTDADKAGLGPLTRILSIDGRSVNDFTASFDQGADLNAKLIDRKRGDRITLVVLTLGARKPREVTLTEGRGVHAFPNQTDSEVEPLRTQHFGISH
jgi:predicted metalloprotease with PDZ domain